MKLRLLTKLSLVTRVEKNVGGPQLAEVAKLPGKVEGKDTEVEIISGTSIMLIDAPLLPD